MDPTALIDATEAPINELGGAFYFTDATAAAGEALGLDVFMFYGLGRGGVLGDVDAHAVANAFIWFKPSIVELVWNEARAIVAPDVAARAFLEAAHAYARQTFVETETLRRFCDAAQAVVDAAPTGRWPLVDGYRRFALPDDTVARAFQLVMVLREMRGAANGDAVHELGITPMESHFLRSADSFELYGYDALEAPEVTDELIERRAIAEDRTTELLVDAYSVLDDDGIEAFLEGVRELASCADIAIESVSD